MELSLQVMEAWDILKIGWSMLANCAAAQGIPQVVDPASPEASVILREHCNFALEMLAKGGEKLILLREAL